MMAGRESQGSPTPVEAVPTPDRRRSRWLGVSRFALAVSMVAGGFAPGQLADARQIDKYTIVECLALPPEALIAQINAGICSLDLNPAAGPVDALGTDGDDDPDRDPNLGDDDEGGGDDDDDDDKPKGNNGFGNGGGDGSPNDKPDNDR